ncbi:alpha/beta fold hydrolase [Pontibacter sp. G13]|uniref:alpha/beta fold hydrolase n=1 Tax=Pontibacter sp. G13 TaxID=3074898 RepID=UPI002889058E|nr:alpha/beta fold hydrolase [Pontibacter sp. G13]WNJ21137.1 alpha/beta fold hydrolase [Pontibacter sp. G13]
MTSLFVPVNDTDTLHIQRLFTNPEGPVVFLVHGSVENGRIFYSQSGKGWGPWLASKGYDVYAIDLRGRGKSVPPVQRGSDYGNPEAILEDIPAALAEIRSIRGADVPMHWGAHSWGGVLLQGYLARFPDSNVLSVMCFGTVRTKKVRNVKRFLNINLGYFGLGALLTGLYGYLPAKRFGFGSDNEPSTLYRQTKAWMLAERWTSPRDGYDYDQRMTECSFPPTLYLAGGADEYLAHVSDIRRHVEPLLDGQTEMWVLSQKAGNHHDYGHNDMLTHKDAPLDHFPKMLDWMKRWES